MSKTEKKVSVFTTINAPMKYFLTESHLLELLKRCEFPAKYDQHIYAFFTEVSPAVICMFCKQNGIFIDTLKSYYFKYIKPIYIQIGNLRRYLMLNEEPKDWKDLLKFADFFLKSVSISSDEWTLGEGTALMLYYKHRLSRDIDIFFNNAQFILLLTPRLNDTTDVVSKLDVIDQSLMGNAPDVVKSFLSEIRKRELP